MVYLLDGKKLQMGFLRVPILGPLLFLIYINNIPKITDNNATVVLFADDTSFIATNCNQGLHTALIKTLSDIYSHSLKSISITQLQQNVLFKI
jgi:predicted helicase